MTTIAKQRLEIIAKELRLLADKQGNIARSEIEVSIGEHAGISPQTMKQYFKWLTKDGTIKETLNNPNLFKVSEGVKNGKTKN